MKFSFVKSCFLSIVALILGQSAVFAQKVAPAPNVIEPLKKMVGSPNDIDKACAKLNIQPRLMNFHLSTRADLKSRFGLAYPVGIHIPVQISDKEGGRSSLYFLKPNQEVLAGIYIAGDNLLLRYVTRLSGITPQAQNGDSYRVELKTVEGKSIYKGEGPLRIIDSRIAHGEIALKKVSGEGHATSVSVWVLWSCIDIEK